MDNSGINQRTHIVVLDRRKPPTYYSLQKDRYSVLALKWPPKPQGHKAAATAMVMPIGKTQAHNDAKREVITWI